MKEKLLQFKNQLLETWGKLTKGKKIGIISTLVVASIFLIFFVYFGTKTSFVPLYSDLSPAEAGEIKEAIIEKGIPVEVSTDGKSVSVPKEEASNLKVELAAEGLPKSGKVDYNVFSENMSFGVTDKQFDVVERDAMQSELENLIKSVDGIEEANVMITLPKEQLWVNEDESVATASVSIETTAGTQLDQKQVNGLYHLISKSIPNLKEENITIMGNGGVSYDYANGAELATGMTLHKEQRQIKKDIESDIQKEIQMMLGRILGNQNVIVSVLANVDFSKEKREEQRVEPVDKETNQGIAVSVERIQEKYKGEGANMEGVAGTGETDVANYPSSDENGQNNEYDKSEERINTEVNRIHKQIEESPYALSDLSINVGVEPPTGESKLSEETLNEIKSVLKSIVRTSVVNKDGQMTEEELDSKITVMVQKFEGEDTTQVVQKEAPQNKTMLYILYGVSGLAFILLVFIILLIVKNSKKNKEQDEEFDDFVAPVKPLLEEIEDFDFDSNNNTPDAMKRKKIERLAKNNPEEFIKLLKTWMSED